MTQRSKDKRFENLTFDDFRQLAKDNSLNQFEKIGFPASYRQGFETQIFEDIRRKLTNMDAERQVILDIGPGCSDLPRYLIDLCRQKQHQLILVDSAEMLAQLPDEAFITKIPGYYPRDCEAVFKEYQHRLGAILTYSVFQYVFAESNPIAFVDKSLQLLSDGGQMLIGDIPNASLRNRFFGSEAGRRTHQEYAAGADIPVPIEPDIPRIGAIDDGVLLGIVSRCRTAGFHAFIMPQAATLPMANRREDILIVKP